MEDLNFEFGEEEKSIREKELEKLEKLCYLQVKQEKDVDNAMKVLAKAQAALKDTREKLIPELMQEMKLKEIKTQEGVEVEVIEKLRASIAQGDMAQQAKAFKWLEDNGHGHLIKREFKIQFGKNEEKWANKFESDLRKRKKPVQVERKQSVHAATLAAFITEQLGKGVKVPLDTFNAFPQHFSKITLPKK